MNKVSSQDDAPPKSGNEPAADGSRGVRPRSGGRSDTPSTLEAGVVDAARDLLWSNSGIERPELQKLADALRNHDHGEAVVLHETEPLAGYARDRRVYLDRHLDTDLALARAGEDPCAGRRVLAFYASEIKRGYRPDARIERLLADAFHETDKAFRNDLAAFEGRLAGSGKKPPKFDVAGYLGVQFGRAGAPPKRGAPLREASLQEAALEVCRSLMRSRAYHAAVQDAANTHGIPVSTLRKHVDAALPEYGVGIGSTVMQRLVAAMEGRDSSDPCAHKEAEDEAIAFVSAAEGMHPDKLWEALEYLRETLRLAVPEASLARTVYRFDPKTGVRVVERIESGQTSARR